MKVVVPLAEGFEEISTKANLNFSKCFPVLSANVSNTYLIEKNNGGI